MITLTLTPDECWQAVLKRDRSYDSRFILGVTSTGIYCRPGCPARTPKRDNVRFFATTAQARAAGLRPCKRCHPDAAVDPNVALVQAVAEALQADRERSPSLVELGRTFGMSPFHLQRVFKRITGVSPKQYVLGLRRQQLRSALKTEGSVTRAMVDSGYSSSALYGQRQAGLGMTPSTFRAGGQSTTIRYTTVPSALGQLLVAATERGVCAVRMADSKHQLERELQAEFPAAVLAADDRELGGYVRQIVRHLNSQQPHLDLPLDVRGTAFQHKVWETLRHIPYGQTRSYQQVAAELGNPKAYRAVANACAHNPVALVIPCHRVVHADGSLSGYRWGAERKRELLVKETRRLVG
jgi:AraC family transcriptional regulator of adaptative response/methylated-DNA-[protein]-cysteine methyltransferase